MIEHNRMCRVVCRVVCAMGVKLVAEEEEEEL